MIERYTRPEMGKIWTPENRYQAWLRVELAVCEAWNRVGEISDADMETLRKEADFTVDRAFVERANEIEETTRHDVIAFLTAIEEKVGPVSRFIHLGCTSSDIVDTAGSLLMVEAGELILKAFDRGLAVPELDPADMPTAFICHCDRAASTLYPYLEKAGCKIPDDVSVISFDNTDICQILSPKLTSLGIDKKVFAVQAFNLMQQAVAKKANGLNYVKINLSLYERESVRSREE